MVTETRTPHALTARHGTAARRIAESAGATDGAALPTDQFPAWLAGRRRAHRFHVERIPFARLQGWSFQESTGNLVHDSGRFFSVEGLHVTVRSTGQEWHQPIIRQAEVGILGILVKEFDGVLHCLMQAKMEPGNPNLLQLSPTVQATRSNYTQAHRGAAVKYLGHFVGPGRGRVLADSLQSEHGSWFFRKRNRNMIVEAVGDVPADDDFCWLTFGQLARLLRHDNVVNMDARTVLACAPVDTPDGADDRALHSDLDLLSWFTDVRARHDVHATRVPLAGLPGWIRTDRAVEHEQGRFFDVVALAVQAGNREVTGWTQPLFAPRGPGVVAFLSRRIEGRTHVLAHARVEGGFLDTVELGPTVQYTPGNYADAAPADRPRHLDTVLTADPARIRYEALHSEEGGRFLNAVSRYLIIEAPDDMPSDPGDDYRWVTPGQLSSLVRHGHYLNVQGRTLLACLHALDVGGDD
ncbi:NDP-hexose 2,3-dehydratase family protein [Streptomyces sp. HD]|uniref:NDP-hexose 2,3-dehydratase family protein n=1 Tax=Streptomyces sp. HD TaxID=3020892 RepID=UPI00232DD285|nr:NDP-hexose 2,3-dehydratase family protein [Streptomyces sp. HD]MDC0772609.1 NDP-hexose 2,3-dehydratase family protein [Streptomyces sp. HD]